MKKIILTTIVALAILVSMVHAKEEKHGFFSTKNLYFFLEAGSIGINPQNPYDYDLAERAFSPIYGVGFTLLNLSDVGRVNFEFDFANPKYSPEDYIESYEQKINFYTYKLNIEYVFKKSFSFFCSIGLTNIHYCENAYFRSNSLPTMLVDVGGKIGITKNIFIRGEIRVLLEPDKNNNYYNSYYTDQSRSIGNIFAMGLEFKL